MQRRRLYECPALNYLHEYYLDRYWWDAHFESEWLGLMKDMDTIYNEMKDESNQ